MRRRPVRNPSFPTGLLVGAVAGAAALAWWATRQSAVATTQALVGGAANAVTGPLRMIEPNREYLADPAAQVNPSQFVHGGGLAYAGDVQGRALTAAEAAAMGLGMAPMDTRRASLTAALQQAQDMTETSRAPS